MAKDDQPKTIEERLDEHLEACAEEKALINTNLTANSEAIKANKTEVANLSKKVDCILDGVPADPKTGTPRKIGVAEMGNIFRNVKRFAKWFGGFVTAAMLAILGALINGMFVAHNDAMNMQELELKIVELLEERNNE